jgi:phosphoribosyl-AMP cyclohydrolase / phosphoribosyl-ATP pyrophosphohydrolase
MRIVDAAQLDGLDFDKGGGLLPVVAQHAHTGEVLMLAWADRAALERVLADGVMWYFSRSRGTLWRKGETSGNTQHVVSLHHDCDSDTVLAHVLPAGPSCHTGAWSCFDAPPVLAALDAVITGRAADLQRTADGAPPVAPPRPGYTHRLLGDANLRLKKLGEEAVELALACERGAADRVAGEAADLLYHVLVACRAAGVSAADVLAELAARAGTPGGTPVSGEDGAPGTGGTASGG